MEYDEMLMLAIEQITTSKYGIVALLKENTGNFRFGHRNIPVCAAYELRNTSVRAALKTPKYFGVRGVNEVLLHVTSARRNLHVLKAARSETLRRFQRRAHRNISEFVSQAHRNILVAKSEISGVFF